MSGPAEATPERRRPPQHPVPGPRQPRRIWTGQSKSSPQEGQIDGVFASHLPPDKEERRQISKDRLLGIDAARGLALIGMFAAHILPAYIEGADRATFVWLIFAGTTASLFGVLAGVGLALSTGGSSPRQGRDFTRALVKIVVRAAVLVIVGMIVNLADLNVYNILVYFAAVFVLALPLLAVPSRPLTVLAAALLLGMPFVRFFVHQIVVDAGYYPNPDFTDVIADPAGVLTTLLVTGVYPALTWIVVIAVGIAVGRMALLRSGAQLTLIFSGIVIFALARAISWVATRNPWGYRLISAAMPGASEEEVDDFIVFGPTGELPTEGLGWLLSGAPHSETPLALAEGVGFSLAAIGVFTVLVRRAPRLLKPLIDVGTMSATVYITHLLLLAYVPEGLAPWGLFLFQVVVALGLAVAWRHFFRQGPVEYLMSMTAKFAGRTLVPPQAPERP